MLKALALRLAIFLLAVSVGGTARAGEGLVALQTADACCPSGTGRYVDCGNGTVTDNETGLVWLANANCFLEGIDEAMDWYQAMAAVAGLADIAEDVCDAYELTPDECDCGLSDGSSPGEWRLPSFEEWDAMVEHAVEVLGCDPALTSDSGGVCWTQTCVDEGGCSFYNVEGPWYWASSSSGSDSSYAWGVHLPDGWVGSIGKLSTGWVWPVRGGQ